MPRLKKSLSPEAQAIADDIRKSYGGMLSLSGVCQLLGVTDNRTAKKFLDGVPCFNVNGRERWMAADLARRLDEARCRT